jgi:radical SAM protein with 4Fe4S-binding SPASM domain
MTESKTYQDQRVPINKGNYTMEPPEREAAFHDCLARGWEAEYSAYRKNWAEYPRSLHVSEYPLLVDLELSTICNLRCPMCYTITEEFRSKVKTGLMKFELFTKVIDEIAGKTPAVRLSLRGEPTIHPRFIDAIRYAKKRGVREVSTLTNGSTLTHDFFLQALEAGIDWITISVDGVGATYEGIRKPLLYPDTLQKIRDIKSVKDERGLCKPVIKVQAIWPSIRDNPEFYYQTFAPYADLIAFNPLIDYLGNDNDITYEDDFSCCQPYQRLVVGADGRVMMCSNDEEGTVIVGNANTEAIRDIWHGERLSSIRDIHKRGGFREISVCRTCYLPRLVEENELAQVNGREFTVKNYVNRTQEIGK